MMDKIGNHNSKILGKGSDTKVEIINGVPKKCCQDELNCPLMPDRCDLKNVIYQADVHAEGTVMSYCGLTENEFKSRCSNHKSAFRDRNRNQTTLSSYV